jgi:hypothetical protein
MALRTAWRSGTDSIDQDREMHTLCVNQQIVLDLVNVSISRNMSLAWIERTQGRHKQEVNPLTFHVILRHASENRVRPGCRMVDGEKGLVRYFRRIPICGVIFSALAFLFYVYFEKRIDFIALSRKRSLRSFAKI